jgi:hypothetical protein
MEAVCNWTEPSAVWRGSATLVAVIIVTLSLLLDTGAVKRPVVETFPVDADQFTDVLAEPVTVAENCCFAPGTSETRDAGVIVIFTGDADKAALTANS